MKFIRFHDMYDLVLLLRRNGVDFERDDIDRYIGDKGLAVRKRRKPPV